MGRPAVSPGWTALDNASLSPRQKLTSGQLSREPRFSILLFHLALPTLQIFGCCRFICSSGKCIWIWPLLQMTYGSTDGKRGSKPPADRFRMTAVRFWSFNPPCYGTISFSKDTVRPKFYRSVEQFAACSNRGLELDSSESPFQIKSSGNQQGVRRVQGYLTVSIFRSREIQIGLGSTTICRAFQSMAFLRGASAG